MTTVYSVGHSNQPMERLLGILRAYRIEALVDIRRSPMSRRNPQFNAEALAVLLEEEGIEYRHEPSLGGRRAARPDSRNTALRSEQFRGFADYMDTDEFGEALGRLVEEASGRRTAVMCAEAVPWRCHRSLIADALVSRGVEVQHIFSATSHRPHTLTAGARLEGGAVSYPTLL
jgi:uncharacterized protein (DUF488 family)